jgi:hypothetical protein
VAALIALAGCGGGGSGTIALADLPTRVVDTLCAAEVSCGLYADAASCRASVTSDLGQLGADVAAGKVKYDGAQAGACLDAFATAFGSCRLSDPRVRQPASCAQTFVGTVPTGGACLVNEDCVSARCTFPSCAVGTCCVGACDAAVAAEGSVAVGGACMSTSQCVAGAFCNFDVTAPTCVALKPAGQACASSEECVSGTACAVNGNPATTVGACVKPPARGEPCTGLFTCDSGGDFCDPATRTCLARVAVGGACTPNTDDCVLYASCDATTSTCVARGAVGAPCVAAAGSSCLSGLTCANGVCATEPPKPVCPNP